MRSRTRGQGDLSAEEAERVTAALRQIRDRECDGSVTALSRTLGVSQPSLSMIFLGQTSPSYALATAVAEHIARRSPGLGRADVDPLRAGSFGRPRTPPPVDVSERQRGAADHASPQPEARQGAVGRSPSQGGHRPLPSGVSFRNMV